MYKLKKGKFWCFLFFLVLFLPVYGADEEGNYGSVWSDTLNFTHHELGLKTGVEGNARTINEQAFDVDQVHQKLRVCVEELKLATGEHNVVVAGLTLLVKLKDHYEAFFEMLKDEKGLPLAFVSGSSPKKGFSNKKYTFISSSRNFTPMGLFQDFGKRLQKVKNPLLQQKEIGGYYETWRTNLEDPLSKAKQEITELTKRDFLSSLDLEEEIQPILEKARQDSNESFGSSTDSEQYFLQFLKREVRPIGSKPKPYLIEECEKLRGSYSTQKMDFFKHKFFDTADIDLLIERTERLKEDLVSFKGALEVGYILHLHSTREVCRCCSVSLSQDLIQSEELSEAIENIAVQRNDRPDIVKPFFLLLSSCSFLMDNPNRKKQQIYVRKGIGERSKLNHGSYSNGTVNIEDIIKRKLFLQKIVV